MKRTKLINRHLSALIARLGHLDEIFVADAGFPTPEGVDVIDLSVVPGLPSFWDVLQALRSELIIESAVLAEEANASLVDNMKWALDDWAAEVNKPITLSKSSHAAMKSRSKQSKAIIRTGETTPYANIILVSGVVF